MSEKMAGRFYDNPDDAPGIRVKNFVIRNILVIIAALALLVTAIIFSAVMSSRQSTLAEQRSEVLALEQQVSVKQGKADEQYAKVVQSATGGLDLEHKRADDEVVVGMLRAALDWNGLREYVSAREEVMRVYDFAEDSQFMTVFMPSEMRGLARRAPDGTMYYAYDSNISNSYSSMESYVTAINGDVYSYMALVQMRTQSNSGNESAESYFRLTYDVVDGKIVNVFADTAPNGVRSST